MVVSRRVHHLIRILCLGITVSSATYIASRVAWRSDVSQEGLSEISTATRDLVGMVASENPVVLTAYVSKDVPKQYVGHRARLLNLLHEIDAAGGDALTVRIYEPELHSDEAQEAQDKYGIVARPVLDSAAGRVGAVPVFLGLAVSSGPREEIISFLDRGLSVEYELARALRTVVLKKKRVVGIVNNDTHLMGSFDMQNLAQIPGWRITQELKKQYEVRSINPTVDVAADVDVLIIPQVSSLSQPQLDKLTAYVEAGRPVLAVADPMPQFDIRLSPSEPMIPQNRSGGAMFGQMGGGEPPPPKGDYEAFLKKLGVSWQKSRVIYDSDNPNPRLPVPAQVAFLRHRDGGVPFQGGSPIVDGLSQVVAIYGGQIEADPESKAEFTPLLTTGLNSGYHPWDSMVERGGFRMTIQGPYPPSEPARALHENVVMAARVVAAGTGEAKGEQADPAKVVDTGKRNAIVLTDLDMFSDVFFSFHEHGGDIDGDGQMDARLDNVTFLLNCIDTLIGDEGFIELRKRQPKFRQLDRVDEQTQDARRLRESEIAQANAQAEAKLAEAQKALNAKIDEIRNREGLDETTKAIMMRQQEEAENRRLKIDQDKIEREKSRQISKIENEHLKKVEAVQNTIRLGAILLPPLPAVLMGLWVLAARRRRESSTIPASRRKS